MVGDLYPTARNVRGGIVAELCAAGFEDAEEIGRGGCGVVYRCTQAGLDRVVAVKVLSVELGQNRARFVREQHAMGRLTGHPNIVAVLQVGETEFGRPYLVMPYCCQGCVQEQIRRCGVLGLEEVLRLGVKMAGALESAHRLGVLHRDVKPANILLDDYDEPELCDFGIARLSGDFETATGIVAGSAAFLAPELLGGEAPSPASDVYGLGATLFCALTGHAAFERRNDEPAAVQLFRIATEAVPDLRDLGIADDCAAVVENAMSRDWRNRPSARELGEEIQHVQACHGFVVDEMQVYGAERTDRHADQPAGSAATRRPRGNLPAPRAGLVGRGRELSQLAELLSASRLVTVTGVGGVGKTTVATQAAHQLVSRFVDGVWLVELGDLGDDSLLTDFVAGAVGVNNQSNRPLLEVLVDFLCRRQVLVVLDNCEHLVDAVAKLTAVLLGQCPGVRILATSREVLDIDGESVLALSPLSCPDVGEHPTLRSLAGYDAVALFVARGAAAVSGFALTQHNAAAMADICDRLEGLPLAIELAAARLRAMSVGQIAEALSDRYGLLSRGRRGAPDRQRTLAGCIGWSYDLCTHAEQGLWAQLSVFAASFDASAAHQVCGDGLSAQRCLDVLCSLVDKSILVRTEKHGMVRFRLLETLRDYGRGRIAESPHHLQLRHRHADYYQRLAATARAEWFSARQVEWFHRITQEMPNLREALQFGLSHQPAIALHMAGDMRPVWLYSGMLGEGHRWLDLALSTAAREPTIQRIQALLGQADIAIAQVDLSAAAVWVGEARNLLTVVDDATARGLVNEIDSWVGLLSGETERAIECCHRALSATDDVEVQVDSLLTIGWELVVDDAHDALSWFEKALTLTEACGDSVLQSQVLTSVGTGRWRLGEFETAERMLREALQISQSINNSWTGATQLEVSAWIAASNHNAQRAAVLMAAAAAVSRAHGAALPYIAMIGKFHGQCERAAREQLSQAEFDAACNQGSAMDFDEAVAYGSHAHHDL